MPARGGLSTFVRDRAKTSIRKRKGIRPPGQPPYSPIDLLRKFTSFAYKTPQSVVMRPTWLKEGPEASCLLGHDSQAVRPTKKGQGDCARGHAPNGADLLAREKSNSPRG
jgi:hypothetical protein